MGTQNCPIPVSLTTGSRVYGASWLSVALNIQAACGCVLCNSIGKPPTVRLVEEAVMVKTMGKLPQSLRLAIFEPDYG